MAIDTSRMLPRGQRPGHGEAVGTDHSVAGTAMGDLANLRCGP